MKHRSKNRHFAGKLVYTGKSNTPTHIQFIQYGENVFNEEKINDIRGIGSRINNDTVSWIRVSGMNDPDLIIRLVKDFGLNILDAKDILTIQHIITVEEYEENIFIVLPVTYLNEKGVGVTEHVALILGKNYVMSFQESNFPLFESVFNAIRENSLRIHNRKADFLLASLLSEVIGNYSDCISQLEDALEELEDQLLDVKNFRKNQMEPIQEKRREMIRIRKLLLPFKDQFAKLLRVDPDLIDPQQIPFLKDIYDQLLYCLQNIESCREIMSSLVDLYLNNNDLKMNIVMKQLTLVATIFIPLTFIVGVWGMNFRIMPELDWKYGYLFAWVIMFIAGFLVWLYLKKKDWF